MARASVGSETSSTQRTPGRTTPGKAAPRGLTFERRWTRPGVHPYDEIEWEIRSASIGNEKGETLFEQKEVEVPASWSQLATNVVVSKYFRGQVDTPGRERSVKELIDRVVDTICGWAERQRYFATPDDLEAFRAELTHLLVHQKMAFNSPVWFNVGVEERPQCSACQPYRALISTPGGMIPIGRLVEDAAIGREVYDAHGVTRVVAVKENGFKPVWRVRLRNGTFIEATPDHVVKAVRGRRTAPEWLRVDQLEVGMRMHLYPHRAKVNVHARATAPVLIPAGIGAPAGELNGFESIDAEAAVLRAEAALAGWLQSDGFVGQYESGTNRSLTIEFQVANDDEYRWVMENLDVALPHVHVKVRDADTKETRLQRIRVYGEVVRAFVERWELLRRGTEIRVPSRLWTAPYDEICAYLRSLFQADGHISVRRDNGNESARIGFAVIGERWTEDVQLLLNVIGIYSRRVHKRDKREGRHDLHEVVVAVGSERARFAELVGFVGRRKQARLLESLGLRDSRTVPNVREEEIVAVEDLGIERVYDIQTESGEYLSNNVAVHNCFINSVQDTMESILTLAKTEGMLFKYGSGTGTNLSPIRSSRERLSGGGTPSGPVSFMKGYDAFAAVIKSGGKTRRAAKMVILDADHPDIVDFIDSKLKEERKAHALIEAGYPADFNGEAYSSIFFQNANHSVRVTDDFMKAVVEDGQWQTRAVTTGQVIDTFRARDLFRRMAETAWACGDPGIQYDTTINDWHTCAATDRIYASNPCVTGDTLVATAQGWRRIDELVGKSADVIGSDGRPHRVDRIFPTGRKPVYELRTRSGYRVRITADHLVSTTNGDVAVKDLRPGDRVHLAGPSFGTTKIEPRLALAIGLAVGDGCLARSRSGANEQATVILTMHANEAGVLEAVAEEVNSQKRLLKAAGSAGRNDGVHVSMSATGSRLAFASRPVVDLFLRFAVLDEGAALKRFTPAVYDLDRGSTAALLRGLFTADGTVANSGEKSQYVGLDSTSLELLVQAQRLLLGFGIKSKIYENRRRGKLEALLPDGRGGVKTYRVREVHSLRISRVSRVLFERKIGFAPQSPKAAALAALNRGVGTYREPLTDGVATVKPLGEEDVFDLTETATRHFVANGILVHNCSEFMFLDDSSCNLASLNLMKFVREDGEFDAEAYEYACRLTITAQEILVDNASYPTERIAERSHIFRPLGLGYANLGALLMSRGLAYDSDEGRAFAAALTAIMTGEAYRQSAIIARDHGGPFAEYRTNEEPFLRVIAKHRDAAYRIPEADAPAELVTEARRAWDEALRLGKRYGYRNAQVTVLAPTGCLVGDSLVLTDRGLVRLRSLGNPDGDKWQPLDLKVGTDDGQRQATKFFVNGAEPVVSVETSRGYRIQGTTTHRIRVVDANGDWRWRRFADLRAGDRVPMMLGGMIGEPREVPLPPLPEAYWTSDHRTFVPRHVTADLAELVGYFMGDGSLHSRGLRFCVTAGDTDVVERLVELGRRLLGLKAKTTPQQGYTEVRFDSVRLALWWEACGFAKRAPNGQHRSKGYEAHVPDAVLYTNDPAVYRAFVRGLFEADGGVNNGYVSYSTVSERFSRDVQTLLLALGFVTTRKVDEIGRGHIGQNPIHVLRLLNASSGARFLAEISLMSERKREALVRNDHPQAARYDLIPVSRETVDRLAPENDHLRKTLLLSLSHTGLVSRRSATALLERTADPDLAETLGYFYDEIASAKLGEEQLTYDISVPSNVTYVANGFVGHNTIAFMMDCDTTGIEPDIALIKYKKLVGGGFLKIVNGTVPPALEKLGYAPAQVNTIVRWVDEHETIEGAPGLEPEHLPVFDCAFKPVHGERSIHYMGHVRMMAATQPFLSGAISKTVNMPEAASPEDVEQVYLEGWRLGLKAIAIYRDGSKKSQPLSTGKKKEEGSEAKAREPEETVKEVVAAAPAPGMAVTPAPGANRHRLPAERAAITHKFEVAGHEGYITVGLYPAGQPGEIFLKMAKEGSTVSGLMDSFATAISLALQYGVPLRDLVNKFAHVRFEPSGFTGNREIPIAKSIIDYIFRWLGAKFLPRDERDALGIIDRSEPETEAGPVAPAGSATAGAAGAGPPGTLRPADASAPATGATEPPATPPTTTATATPPETPKAELPVGERAEANGKGGNGRGAEASAGVALAFGTKRVAFRIQEDAPSCAECGSIMVRNGSCYKCVNCGSTSGCS